MKWHRISALCLASGYYRVAKVCVNGEWLYEAWRCDGHSNEPLGMRLKTATEAKTLCEVDDEASQSQSA